MIEEEKVRHLREVLTVLTQLLQRSTMFDALKSEEDHLNFYRRYKGSLFESIVIDWWKVFGNRRDLSHWKNLVPQDCHAEIERTLDQSLSSFRLELNRKSLRDEIELFRHNYVAHLNFNQEGRPNSFPNLTPLRLTAEIIYNEIFLMRPQHNPLLHHIKDVNPFGGCNWAA